MRAFTWCALFALVGMSACSNAGKPEAKATGPLHVTATIGMIADVAKNIGGEHIEVIGLMGPGVDPHLYQATQGDLAKLRGADLILYNGLHLEGRMADVLEKMGERVRTVAVTDTIPEEKLTAPPEFKGHFDPHVWFDVSLWRIASERIRDAMIEARPDLRESLEANAAAYLKELDALHEYAKEHLATIPEPQRVLVTAHDAFGYFGRAYGLQVLGLQGISTASEYGLQDLTNLVDVLVERKIKAVFVETSIPRDSIEALVRGAESKGHNVAIGGVLFSDAMGEDGTPKGTYIGMVRHNIDTIVEALR